MEYGNRSSFAVEFELDKNYGGEWLYGKFCYWIGGLRVGDFEMGTSLRDVLLQMKHMVSDCGNRDGGTLCSLSPAEAFSVIDPLLYGESSNNALGSPDTPARFDISIPVDVFDSWKIYLFECKDSAEIVFRKNSEAKVRSYSLRHGEFDQIIKKVYLKLDDLYEKQIKK